MASLFSPSETDSAAHRLYGPWGVGVVIAALVILRLVYLAFYPLGLHPDEAQYWSWSRDLAFGYFSKPPMVAWIIAATTALCGDGAGCVKAGMPVVYGLAALLIYGAARRLYDRRVGFFAAVIFALLPGVSFSSAIVSTDPPLLLFWSLAFYALVRLGAGESENWRWWVVLGAGIGFGLLSKYAMGFFVASLVVWLVMDRQARAHYLGHPSVRRGMALAMGLGFVIYLPNLIWNMGTRFVTYAHTGSNANLGADLFRPDKFLEFFAAQFALFGPFLFVALLWLLFRPATWRGRSRESMLVSFIVTMGLPILALSLLTRANANWAAPVYVAGSIWVAGAFLKEGRRLLIHGSLVLHGVFAAILMGGVVTAGKPGVYAGIAVAAKLDLYRHHRGWEEIGKRVAMVRVRNPGAALLVRDRMAMAALLHGARDQARLPDDYYAWHPDGRISDHFRLTRPWTAAQKGRDALIVSLWPEPRDILSRFASRRLLQVIKVPTGTGTTRRIWVFYGRGFIGYKPARGG